MKINVLWMSACVAFMVCACNDPERQSNEVEVNKAEAKWLNDSAIQNAIIAQHSLYSYHFIAYSPSLNELGEHDLGVLIDHYKTHPGPLNIHRGDNSMELQEARVRVVSEKLVKAGIDLAPTEDGLPGGDSMLSEHVLMVIDRGTLPSTETSKSAFQRPPAHSAVANQGGSIK